MLAVAPRSPRPGSVVACDRACYTARRRPSRALAAAAGVAPSAITLRKGARSRTKIFVVEELC